MTMPIAQWKPWQRGRVTLHLVGGKALWFDGRVRLKETATEAVDYAAETESFVMIPAFGDVIAIEVH